ncbi:MAG TPA: OmpH family outer membrane protein, partial [Bryobacteraceae bacterium]|nr:OmpH family outer membrane protein [Bryobacteraceae bacterium]
FDVDMTTSVITPQRVAVIRMRDAIESTQEGKKAIAELSSMVAARQAELRKEQAEIEALQKRLINGGSALNGGAAEDIRRDIEVKSRRFQRRLEDLQWEAQQRERAIYESIGGRMHKIIADFAEKNNFVLVMDVRDAVTPVVWASGVVNITGRIVQQYDFAYPPKAETAGPKADAPPAPKPQPPSARPQPRPAAKAK